MSVNMVFFSLFTKIVKQLNSINIKKEILKTNIKFVTFKSSILVSTFSFCVYSQTTLNLSPKQTFPDEAYNVI